MAEKRYVVSLKRDKKTAARGFAPDRAESEDLRERLSRIEGVSVLGATARRAQFTAGAEAARKVREELGDRFHVEEVVERDVL